MADIIAGKETRRYLSAGFFTVAAGRRKVKNMQSIMRCVRQISVWCGKERDVHSTGAVVDPSYPPPRNKSRFGYGPGKGWCLVAEESFCRNFRRFTTTYKSDSRWHTYCSYGGHRWSRAC